MKTADQHRAEIRAIFEANRRQYIALRIADAMHPDALVMHTCAPEQKQ